MQKRGNMVEFQDLKIARAALFLDFNEISSGDTLGIQLEESCSNQALTKERSK